MATKQPMSDGKMIKNWLKNALDLKLIALRSCEKDKQIKQSPTIVLVRELMKRDSVEVALAKPGENFINLEEEALLLVIPFT